jgi:hypothetical protein
MLGEGNEAVKVRFKRPSLEVIVGLRVAQSQSHRH